MTWRNIIYTGCNVYIYIYDEVPTSKLINISRDCYLTPSELFFSYISSEYKLHIVLDQHAKLDFYSAD